MKKAIILIVEDSTSNRVYLEELLTPYYTVIATDNGEEALSLAEKELPDLILLDIVLPGINGYETCIRLRQNRLLHHTKIIGISTRVKTDERLLGYQSGMDDYVAKPFNCEELLAKIRVFLRLKSAEEVADQLQQAYRQTVKSLVRAMETKDPYTGGHSERVAMYAVKLGRHLGLERKQLTQLEWAGNVHDIGKIGVPDHILQKEGPLTEAEYEIIQTHPVKSFKVLEPVEALESILTAVKYHHEHYDGSGYPEGLMGEEIPLFARIIHLADVWDALTSSRPYRPALNFEKACRIIREEAGVKSDPRLAARFLDMIESDSTLIGNLQFNTG